MKLALLLILSFPLWAQFQNVPSTRYPGLEAILNAKPAAQVAAGVPSGNCTVGKDFYVNSTAHTLYYCSATNTWVQIAGATASTTVNGTTCTLGSTCTVTATPTAHATTHAAGGTDAVTLTEAQITSLTTDLAAKAPLASPTLTGTPAAPTASLGTNTTQVATTAFVQAAIIPALPTPGSTCTWTGTSGYCVCTTTCTVTPPTPATGSQFCARNATGVSTVITLAAIASSYYEKVDGSAYGTVNSTMVSSGSTGDRICILGLDSTHYLTMSYGGTWTAN